MSIATITMPREFDGAIQEIVNQARAAAVQALSEKYGFEADEANRFLIEGGIKMVKMRGPAPKAKKATKTKKTESDGEAKPKKALTGYLLYSKEHRSEVKDALLMDLEGDAKLAPQSIVKQLAADWKALDEDEKMEWAIQAKQLAVE